MTQIFDGVLCRLIEKTAGALPPSIKFAFPANTLNVVNCGQRSQRRSTACCATVGTTSPPSAVFRVTRSAGVGANTPRSARLVGGRGRPSQYNQHHPQVGEGHQRRRSIMNPDRANNISPGAGDPRRDIEDLLTLREVAHLLRVPEATLRYWRHRHTGPDSYKIGRHIRYQRNDVQAWVRRQRTTGGPGAA
jgi:excisionase family DNA binding protein